MSLSLSLLSSYATYRTALTCEDQSFDVVLDKGALDALLSIDDEALRDKASDMFAHIDRVLVPGGKVRVGG